MSQFKLYAIHMDGIARMSTDHACENAIESYERAEDILRKDAKVLSVEVWRTDELLFTVKQQTEPLDA